MFEIKNKKRFLIIFWGVITSPFLIIGSLLFLIWLGAFGTLPTFEELENPKSNISTEVISEDGKLLGSYFIQNRSFVDYDDLSPYLVASLVSTEDSRYYDHSGIDFMGLARVGVRTLMMGDRSQGGGSTISQQLAKNLYPRDTTTYTSSVARTSSLVVAKLKEWITATMLEYNYTKEEIVVMYLNIVAYGSNAYGIKSAAQTFFAKTPADLNIEEAALLVGVVNAPTRYSPVRNYDRSLTRRNTVIRRMESSGIISSHVADSICELPITLKYKQISHNEGIATYFRGMLSQYMNASEPKRAQFNSDWDYQQQLKLWRSNPLYGWCKKNTKADGSNYNIYRDGLKIYTTVNYTMQKYAEESVHEQMKDVVQPRFKSQMRHAKTIFNDLNKDQIASIMRNSMRQTDRYRTLKNSGASEKQITENFNTKTEINLFSYDKPEGIDTLMTPHDSILYSKALLRAGFIAIEPSSGYVKAYVGGTSFRHFKYDMAMQGKRQAGSTFKPFIYTFAIDHLGISPCQGVPNLPVSIEGWSPKEAGKVEYDGVENPLWWGLARSRNNYSAWIMKQANQPQAVADLIYRLGIKSYVDPVPALCLGSADVSLYEMVGAYSDFVNMGVHIEPMFVTRIEDKHGNIIATFSPQSNDAISAQSAYTMVGMLQNVVNRGTAARLRGTYKFTGEMGGKTGTTNKNSDAWFIGIAPKIVAGAWIGGEDRSIHLRYGGEGSALALPIFGKFMTKVYADKSTGISERDRFMRPAGVTMFDCSTSQPAEQTVQQETAQEDEFFQ